MTYLDFNTPAIPLPTYHNFNDLTGQRFNRLTIINYQGLTPRKEKTKGQSQWLCLCDCGTYTIIRSNSIVTHATKSCGCLNYETKHRIHSPTNKPYYGIWRHMKERCYDPKTKGYKDYGQRGIKICPEWHSLEQFVKDMAPRPSLQHSIERRDNNGDYCPENCYWGTPTEQANNRRNNRILTFQHKSQTLSQWAKELNLPSTTLSKRLANKWTVERALTTPVRFVSQTFRLLSI